MTEPLPRECEGYCHCSEPVLDSDVGEADGDDDWCWRCRQPIHDTPCPSRPAPKGRRFRLI